MGDSGKTYCDVVRDVYMVRAKQRAGEGGGNSDPTLVLLMWVRSEFKSNPIVDALGHLR